MHPWGNDGTVEYVKFEEAKKASSNSLQQLKAEIAALADYCEQRVMDGFTTDELDILLDRLRQLSAI